MNVRRSGRGLYSRELAFRCANPQCPNREKGRHFSLAASKACGLRARRSGAIGVDIVPTRPTGPQGPTLKELEVLRREHGASDDELLLLPGVSELSDFHREVWLSLARLCAEGVSALQEDGHIDTVAYVQESFTGFTSLSGWEEHELAQGRTVPAEVAIAEGDIWTLPNHAAIHTGAYFVMQRARSRRDHERAPK